MTGGGGGGRGKMLCSDIDLYALCDNYHVSPQTRSARARNPGDKRKWRNEIKALKGELRQREEV